MDEYLWPARNVAEYAYCPRLFYFMEVEGIHLPSADTEQGVAVHKRVDRASAERADDADPDSPAPDDPGEDEPPAPTVEPWPTDRIQVGLQALLLEEAGFTVPEAIIYYAAVKLRVRVPVDTALRDDAMKVLHDAQA